MRKIVLSLAGAAAVAAAATYGMKHAHSAPPEEPRAYTQNLVQTNSGLQIYVDCTGGHRIPGNLDRVQMKTFTINARGCGPTTPPYPPLAHTNK